MATKIEVSIPLKLLFEAVNQLITVELYSGDKYKGELTKAEANMSVSLSNVTHIDKNGQLKRLELVYLRGSQVKFFIFPKILQQAPMFRKVTNAKRKYDKRQSEKMKMLSRNGRSSILGKRKG